MAPHFTNQVNTVRPLLNEKLLVKPTYAHIKQNSGLTKSFKTNTEKYIFLNFFRLLATQYVCGWLHLFYLSLSISYQQT